MADAMDSKSISREGVGVQVPASAPPVGLSSELAGKLLPVLLHKLNNVTQVFSGLNSLLAVTGDPALLVERAGDLEHAGAQLHRLGWLVGMIGASQGADLLLARREALGLRWSLEALAELCAREQVRLELPAQLPRVCPQENEAAICWDLLLWIRSQPAQPVLRLSWTRTSDQWIFRLEGSAASHALPAGALEPLS